ncbi:MAG: exodeoxyribonuclease VII large subunit [Wenzhouxiangellaceae bacterium]|nr:exodeoxyribonuclease VII large subunit [Wenzhouxiangellaceae bacterium]
MHVQAPGPETRVYQPGELNREVRLHLEAGFPRLWLTGEISNLARPASGHWYFTLKDDRAQVRCALFRGQRGNVEGEPANGDQVLVRGRLSLYEARGEYQLIADAMLPAGAGALQQAFEALKKKLESEGLFAAGHKKPLPAYPRAIGVVTSPTGAAIRDILTTLKRRWPAARVHVYETPVQGEEAVPGLLAALDALEREGAVDVAIIARGGGSLEDLWAFNDERLARRIHSLAIPIVSGVGHETDFTIADFVADLRAATPTAAAEAVTPDGPALARQVAALDQRLLRAQTRRLQQAWQRLDAIDRRLAGQHPARRLTEGRRRLENLERRTARAAGNALRNAGARHAVLDKRLAARHPGKTVAERAVEHAGKHARLKRAIMVELSRHSARLAETARALNAVSPLAVLARGYAIVEDESGRLLSRREDFSSGQTIHTRVRDFRVTSEVRGIESAGTPAASPDDPGKKAK